MTIMPGKPDKLVSNGRREQVCSPLWQTFSKRLWRPTPLCDRSGVENLGAGAGTHLDCEEFLGGEADGVVPDAGSDGVVPGTSSDGVVPGTSSDGVVPGTSPDAGSNTGLDVGPGGETRSDEGGSGCAVGNSGNAGSLALG